ncbi:MAG: FecR domain-containing protein [Spirochaetes bacterium]|nr:FecR domain-containing protein [Spirochaetota bacterium]
MKHFIILALSVSLGACGRGSSQNDGVITLAKGLASIEHREADGTKKTREAKVGEKIAIGDTIVTSENGTLIFEINGAKMEIQHSTRFVYEKGGDNRVVYLERGRVWTQVDKLGDKGKFTLRTPVTIAGVRGTKFYTAANGETTGTCHCEGKIDFKNVASGKDEINNEDYLMFYRGSKAVKITPADFKSLGILTVHNHSEIDDSAIGKRNKLTAAQEAKVQSLVEKRFAAIK